MMAKRESDEAIQNLFVTRQDCLTIARNDALSADDQRGRRGAPFTQAYLPWQCLN